MTADRASLGILGIMLGALTAATMLMMLVVLFGHVERPLTFGAPESFCNAALGLLDRTAAVR